MLEQAEALHVKDIRGLFFAELRTLLTVECTRSRA